MLNLLLVVTHGSAQYAVQRGADANEGGHHSIKIHCGMWGWGVRCALCVYQVFGDAWGGFFFLCVGGTIELL